MVSLFASFRRRFLTKRRRFQAILNVCGSGHSEQHDDDAAANKDNEIFDVDGPAKAEDVGSSSSEIQSSTGENSSSGSSVSSATRNDEFSEKDPWPEILRKLTTEAKGKFEDGLESEKFITVGVGFRFMASQKESFIGKHVNSKFIDLVIEILQTHMHLQYFREVVSLEGLKLTIRNSRHIIYATVHRNLITVIAFDNLKMIPELHAIPTYDHSHPCKSTLPISASNSLNQIAENVSYNPNWVSPSPLASCSPISSFSQITSSQQSSASSSYAACTPTPPPQAPSSGLMFGSTTATEESNSIPSSMNLNSQSSSSFGSLNEVKKIHYNHHNQKNLSSIFKGPDMVQINNMLAVPNQNPMLRL